MTDAGMAQAVKAAEDNDPYFPKPLNYHSSTGRSSNTEPVEKSLQVCGKTTSAPELEFKYRAII